MRRQCEVFVAAFHSGCRLARLDVGGAVGDPASAVRIVTARVRSVFELDEPSAVKPAP